MLQGSEWKECRGIGNAETDLFSRLECDLNGVSLVVKIFIYCCNSLTECISSAHFFVAPNQVKTYYIF